MNILRILATAPRGREFAIADAIDALGGLAVVPRQVTITEAKDGKAAIYDYRPFLQNFLFLSLDALLWHRIQTRAKGCILRTDDGRILPPPRRQLDILPRTWADFQGFADRAELACELRIEQHETGAQVARYRQGDILRILGDLLDGQLRDKLAKFISMEGGKIVVEVQGMDMMGKPLLARLDGWDVEGVAAE